MKGEDNNAKKDLLEIFRVVVVKRGLWTYYYCRDNKISDKRILLLNLRARGFLFGLLGRRLRE